MSGISLRELDAQHGELLPEREALGVFGRSFGPCHYHPVDCHHRDFFDHHCGDHDNHHGGDHDHGGCGDGGYGDDGHGDGGHGDGGHGDGGYGDGGYGDDGHHYRFGG